MYEQVFGLKNRPFTSTPYVQNYFPADSIHHALSQLRLTIERAAGPAIVMGASGTGKSLLLAMLSEYFKSEFQVINLVCANMVERTDLLQSLLFEMQLPYRNMSEGELRLSLIDCLKGQPKKPNGILLLVDEAHSLSKEILDELRVITNFSRNGRPVLSLVMAGLPSLEEHLIETKSESLNQRIAARCYLSNLSQTETFDYIVTHLDRAGGNGETIFTGEAINSIHQFSDGCPRIINQVCDYALVLAASQNIKRVSAEIASDAWNDVQSIPGASTTNYVESPSTNEDLMVLEFGTLDTPDDSIEFGSLESDDGPTIYPVQQESINADLDESTHGQSETDQIEDEFEYRLQSVDDSTSAANQGNESEINDFDFSITDDNVQDDQLHSFENPFDEPFQEEENVFAAFVPEVSEQNLNSLMVTSEQLMLLEEIENHADDDLQLVESPISGSTESEKEPAGTKGTLDYQDLRMTPEALEGLEQVEEDVRQLQRDLMFTDREFSSQAVHPDYEYCDQNQPVEELFQDFDVLDSEDRADEVTQSMELDHEQDTTTIQFESEIVSQETTIEGTDDRDMMVISQPETYRVDTNDESEDFLNEHHRISTGNARRMDYKELFHQLRTAN